jgi:acyl-CoA thioesterase FadM
MEAGSAPSLLTTRRHVPMADVDAAGILYFGAPYRWLEEAFTGWLNGLGRPLSGLIRSGWGCPCVTSATLYGVPLVLDDEISVSLRPSSLGRTSFSLTTEATRLRDGAVAVRSTGWHVWSEFDGRADPPVVQPTPVPDWLSEAFAATTWTLPVTTTHVPAESGASR